MLPAAALRGLDICFSELLPDVSAVPYASMANDGLDLLGGEALGACDRLSELYLGFSLLGAEATLALAQSLPAMRALQTLFLRDAGVEEGAHHASDAVLESCGCSSPCRVCSCLLLSACKLASVLSGPAASTHAQTLWPRCCCCW